ncbi:hypothetical protein H310_04254 [Aphanomyces invadans]|nr:hypothetical protein H310_04254 [Aphanomyces invadans]ETW05301.1 hypothetical protein H310_04254 [Aphanomyces invadans]|eukprot:XP_008866739.1 hypothetical protein H310_04254 [Aphanomyces invadans]
MLIMNQLPSPSLGGLAPVTAMSSRPAMSPMDTISLPGSLKSATLNEIESMQRANIDNSRAALDAMHKEMNAANALKRDRARKPHDKKRGVKMAQFVVGYYVLYQDVWQHHRAKLRTTWCGPAVLTFVTSSWLYVFKNLITGDEREAHASRLKFYADKSLHLSEDLKEHVAHNSDGYEVEAILDALYIAAKKSYEVLIKWRGLQVVENAWEPTATIYEDVAVAFKNFSTKKGSSAVIKQIANDYSVME